MATKRFVINRPGEGKSNVGNIMISITIGRPIMVGVMKEANKFSFILYLKDLGT